MKNLALSSLIALAASQAAGCTSSSDDTTELAHIGVSWDIKNVDGTATPCPPDFDTATLYTQAADANGNPVGTCLHQSDISGTCFIDLFSCADGHGTSAPLPPTNYISWLQIENHDGSMVYARGVNPKSPDGDSTLLDVTDVDLAYDTEVFNDGGHFRLTWNLVGGTTGAALTCAVAGAGAPGGGVEILSTLSGTTAAASDIFTCEDGVGTTTGLPAGSYTISVDALNPSMQSLGTAPAASNKTIGVQSMITDLPNQMISIDGM